MPDIEDILKTYVPYARGSVEEALKRHRFLFSPMMNSAEKAKECFGKKTRFDILYGPSLFYSHGKFSVGMYFDINLSEPKTYSKICDWHEWLDKQSKRFREYVGYTPSNIPLLALETCCERYGRITRKELKTKDKVFYNLLKKQGQLKCIPE